MAVHPPASDHLRLDGVSHSYGDRRVLTDLTLVVDPAQRVGLIGENGAGKSTLLRILSRVETPDAGAVSGPASTGLLRQELPFAPTERLDDVLESALAPVRAAERALEGAARGLSGAGAAPDADERYAAALERAERLDVWSAEARRDAVLRGLGLHGVPRTRRLEEISGGQRSRLALAALLLERPRALLLDEPTNHLDAAATVFLLDALREWSGPVVFASHDRAFLDEAATDVVDIDPQLTGGLRRHGGGFSDYLVEKEAERTRWQRRFDEEQEEQARLAESVAVTSRRVAPNRGPRDNERMGYGKRANRVAHQLSRRVRNARGRLDELEQSRAEAPPARLSFAGIPHGAHPLPEDGGALVRLDRVHVSGRLGSAERPVSVAIGARTRLLVTGVNGAGKSTLLGLLAGAAAGARSGSDADSDVLAGSGAAAPNLAGGTVQHRRGVRVGLLAQDVRFAHPEHPAGAIYRTAVGEAVAERVPLSRLGLLAAADLDRPVAALSVGQQRRLALALIIARPPHLFLLDEPTNHLSLALAVELEEAFGEYPGAVVVASHDRWLRRRWQGGVLAL
jgi:macrolide transport system ATP-binding/permease protein